MEQKYFVSVFVQNKYANSYFSKNLDDLVTIKALHKDCEIYIFDVENCVRYTSEQVENEIINSGKRWKMSLSQQREYVENEEKEEQKPKPKYKKYWERAVMCVETGQIFGSIRACSDRIGIPYMTIVNCIKNGNATRGLHFVNASSMCPTDSALNGKIIL